MAVKVYLASPYSHPDPAVRQKRFEQVCRKAADLMYDGFHVFCPIAHTHPLTEYSTLLLNKDHEFWLEQDYTWLDMCDYVFVYKLPGWDKSYGVKAEIDRAKAKGIMVEYHESDEGV